MPRMAHSRSNLARLNECQSYFKPTSLVQVSKSWKRAPDSWRAHSLATSDPSGRCSGPLQVLRAGELLPVITFPLRSHTHTEKKGYFPKRIQGVLWKSWWTLGDQIYRSWYWKMEEELRGEMCTGWIVTPGTESTCNTCSNRIPESGVQTKDNSLQMLLCYESVRI